MDNNDTSLGFQFDARQFAPSVGYENLPEGWQNVCIDSAKWKDDRSGIRIGIKSVTGVQGTASINLTFTGDPKAMGASQGALSALCHVTGIYNISDLRVLFNIPWWANIKHKKDGDAVYANVVGYRDMQGNEPGKTGTASPQPMQAQTTAPAPAQTQFPVSQGVPFTPAPAAAAPAQGGWAPAQPAAAPAPAPANAAPGFNQAPPSNSPPWGAR